MKVAIYGQVLAQDDVTYVNELLETLFLEKAEVAIEIDFLEQYISYNGTSDYSSFSQNEGLDASFDLFVSFGGDGTMLRAISYVG